MKHRLGNRHKPLFLGQGRHAVAGADHHVNVFEISSNWVGLRRLLHLKAGPCLGFPLPLQAVYGSRYCRVPDYQYTKVHVGNRDLGRGGVAGLRLVTAAGQEKGKE